MRKSSIIERLGKKMTSITLAVVLVAGSLVGCGGTTAPPDGSGEEVEIDDNKTLLTVAIHDGGLNGPWIEESARRFEKKFADTSFEEGKKGVQVTILANTNYIGAAVLETLKYESADVWFTTAVDFNEHVNKGNFLDISDIVTEKLTEYGEDKSIADKIDDDLRSYLNMGTEDAPLYYALPFCDGIDGLTYDKDLFAERNLYFKSSGTEVGDAADNLGFVSSKKDKKSTGVDGKYGTYDDGLPATYAQFLSLIEKMKENDITPFIYAGANAIGYPRRTMASFWAQAEGPERYSLNYSHDGIADNLVKMDANGKIMRAADGSLQLETLQITQDNAYELQRSVNKYYVLELFNTILQDKKNYSDSTFIHTDAQANFIKGKNSDYTTYGMLFDGCWWMNESRDAFDALATRYGDDYKAENRNFGFMPLPVPTSEYVGRQSTCFDETSSMAFIRSTTEIPDCAKAFLQFTSTDEELRAFTSSMQNTRSLNFEVTPEYKETLTSFGKDMVELKQSAKVIYLNSKSNLFVKNYSVFSCDEWSFTTVLDKSTYNNPWQLWLNYPDRFSVDEYFEGMRQYYLTKWPTLYR